MIAYLAVATLIAAPVLNIIGVLKAARAYRSGNVLKMLSGGTMVVGSVVLLGILSSISNLPQ